MKFLILLFCFTAQAATTPFSFWNQKKSVYVNKIACDGSSFATCLGPVILNRVALNYPLASQAYTSSCVSGNSSVVAGTAYPNVWYCKSNAVYSGGYQSGQSCSSLVSCYFANSKPSCDTSDWKYVFHEQVITQANLATYCTTDPNL